MLRPARFLTAILIALVSLALLGIGPSATALAPIKPTISSVVPEAGPLKATVVTIKGKNLGGAKAVSFGKKNGKIVRRVDAQTVQVRTPKGMKAGTVVVRIQTKGGWSSKTSSKARYTFVKAPELKKLSSTKGSFAGGQRLTLSGKNLKAATRVLFGELPAAIVSKNSTSVVVTSPVGVVGATKVVVSSPGGSSKGLTFNYGAPATSSKSTVSPAAGSVVPSEVDWVTGGQSETGSATSSWLVGLPPGALVPTIGAKFVLRPGTEVFPSGLAGTVSDVAVQADDSVRVTVSPTDLFAVVDRVKIDYDGSVLFPVATQGNRARRQRESEVTRGTTFAIRGPTALFCTDANGQEVKFGADLSMSVTDVDVSQHLDLGGLVHRPTFDAAFTAELKTTGKISVAAAATCKLKPAWQNAQRRVIPLGTTGATVSFGPTLEFKVTAKGTYSLTDRTRTTFAVSAEYGKTPTFTRTSRSVESKHGGALSFTTELTVGASVQLGILDRAGLQGKVLLGVSASITASDGNVCVEGKLFARMTIGVFLDVWVARWEGQAFTATLDIGRVHGCVLAETSAPEGEPEITSARLADAIIGEPYDARLTTADDREGRWSLVSGALPSGLSLEEGSGTITGTPEGPVGDSAVIIDFADADGRVATTSVRVFVRPSEGLGGGNIQITLKWTGSADLDLDVFDPAGEEIWYGHRGSASGGLLDHDANAACQDTGDGDAPVENVFWPPNGAPAGTYIAAVRVYDDCGVSVDWHLIVRRNGVVILDQTGAGDSLGFAFGVGPAAAVRMSRTAISTAHAPK